MCVRNGGKNRRQEGSDQLSRKIGAPLSSESRAASVDVPTFGVEEEFLLVDRETRVPTPCVSMVLKSAGEVLGDQVQAELFPTQVETCTRPVRTLQELRGELLRLRTAIAAAAAETGCLAVASGTAVVPAPGSFEVTGSSRYLRMAAEFGAVTDELGSGVCGCHVHVAVSCRDEAVRLGNHLRPWLPTVGALAANSPFRKGWDSGYASWRAMSWSQWPGVGPPPMLPDAAAYDALVDSLIAAGFMLDRGMIYWYARPSEHFPTLEVRVADVNADLDTVVLLAALVRGLTATLVGAVRADEPAPAIPDRLLQAAHWRAARDGLAGFGLDLAAGRPRPAVELVEALIERAAPGLEAAGDMDEVQALWRRVRLARGGAARQREAYRRRGDLRDVVDDLTVQ
ncbi:MAG: glutamate--cysteine ligase [Streptomycetaceae bacterium]|nr:glutamate--cysteine ligase [Streptomycetaceae bacterium]